MDYSNLITEKSEIDLGEHYISIKNLKAKISKSFNTNIIAESNDSFSCKIIRMARLYGAPVPFPNPTYKVKVRGEGKNTKVMS